jgi:hypothetical protein
VKPHRDESSDERQHREQCREGRNGGFDIWHGTLPVVRRPGAPYVARSTVVMQPFMSE